MQVRLLMFAQAADVAGYRERTIECDPAETPYSVISREAPQLSTASLRVAVDYEYRNWDQSIGLATEIAVIPPVSGG